MRILYVITPSRLSGAERQLLRTAQAQQRAGDDVRILSKRLPPFEQAGRDAGVDLVTGLIGGKLNMAATARIAEHCRAFGPDIVVTMHSTATLWGVRAARRAGAPCVAWVQCVNTPWPYTRAPAAIGCAEYVRQHLMAAGMSEERVYAVPNCIDPSPFLDDDDRQAARADLGLADEEVAVGTMAHFTPRKAHSDLLEAAALVAPQAPHVRWLWAGEGPLEARMRARARGLGLADRVCFLGYRSDAPRLHRAFDILALPSLAEGLPLVVLEAMASARPCVVTNVSGNPEIVADGATGLLVPPRCPSAMGEALLALARDPDLRARMGEAGRRRVLERFTMERMVELMRDVMDREIARQSM